MCTPSPPSPPRRANRGCDVSEKTIGNIRNFNYLLWIFTVCWVHLGKSHIPMRIYSDFGPNWHHFGSKMIPGRVPGEPLLDPPGGPAGGARATPGSVPRLPGLLAAAPGAPGDHLGMQNGPQINEIRASGRAPGSICHAQWSHD